MRRGKQHPNNNHLTCFIFDDGEQVFFNTCRRSNENCDNMKRASLKKPPPPLPP